MSPLETVDLSLMKAAFPEFPTNGLEAATGEVRLLMGQDNLGLFPVVPRRLENTALHIWFGTGWIA
jgi:hypothetical protein